MSNFIKNSPPFTKEENYDLDYKLEQESLNREMDSALAEYFSKTGGKGGRYEKIFYY